MSPRMFRLLLLGIVTVLFMDEGGRVLTIKGIRYCHKCKHFDGYKCHTGMKTCWKLNLLPENKSCSTENYYYTDRRTGRHLFRYSVLSCKPCEAGMSQLYHDLMKETFCCTNENKCNDGSANFDTGYITLEEPE